MMITNVKQWELRRATNDAIDLIHGTYSDRALRMNLAIVYDTPALIPDYVKKAVVKMFKVNYDQLVGFYHEHGYSVWRQTDGRLRGDDALYEAGNNPAESIGHVPVEDGETLATLKRYCIQTGKEMAEELGIPWGGCDREDDPWVDEDDDF